MSDFDVATSGQSAQSAVLVVGHPGHELRVHGWMERAHPIVCVLTDGSGSTGQGRLESTTRVLERTGSRQGPIYGRLSDRDIYTAILDQDLDLFLGLADELSAELVARRDEVVRVTLDEDALARKLESANGYPELAGEVADALGRFGTAPFQRELLRPVDLDERLGWRPRSARGAHDAHDAPDAEAVPFYERYGEKRVAEGVYDRVLRFRTHVVPLAEALWRHSMRGD